ncbi:unnamed protein product [Protopolystoma xenopodis]|uniref:UBA domain-containing protein n=1 Tax=Protopolystoma xenopodis TaxID=117903 RepID=A0A3S5AGT2_9PLAT|nr:unnamed protein product [Protopolystoma xenopodis]
MSKKADLGPSMVRDHHSKPLEDGSSYCKMPVATAEQITIAAIVAKPINDERQRQQLQELTRCSEERAFIALHDASGDIDKAVEFLLEGHEDTWFSTSKRAKVKSTQKQSGVEAGIDRRRIKNQSGSIRRRENVASLDATEAPTRPLRSDRIKTNQFTGRGKSQSQNSSILDNGDPSAFRLSGWDPASDYGEWTGEAIEIINSNASIALNLNDARGSCLDLVNGGETLNSENA